MSRARAPELPVEVWLDAARRHAKLRRAPLGQVMSGARNRAACVARWGAWREILADFPACGYMGLERLTGFDHSTIISGLRRLPILSAEFEEVASAPPPIECAEVRMRRSWAESAKLTRVSGGAW